MRSAFAGRIVVALPVMPPCAVTDALPCAALAAVRLASTALGPVRMTVAVSLRGTAWLAASAAVCGDTPTAAGVCIVPIGAVVVVCAKEVSDALANAVTARAAHACLRSFIWKSFEKWIKKNSPSCTHFEFLQTCGTARLGKNFNFGECTKAYDESFCICRTADASFDGLADTFGCARYRLNSISDGDAPPNCYNFRSGLPLIYKG